MLALPLLQRQCKRCGGSMGRTQFQNGRERTVCRVCKAKQRKRRLHRSGGFRKYYKASSLLIAGPCPNCSVPVIAPPATRNVYCSVPCMREHQRRSVRVCVHCSREFIPKSVDRVTYCSRQCNYAAKWQHRGRVSHVYYPQCFCGEVFVSRTLDRKFCSTPCRSRELYLRLRQPETRARHQDVHCAECGNMFRQTHGAQVYCSEFCSARNAKRRGGVNHRQRARARGLPYESVSAVKVFERDGWRCVLCECPTPKTLRGTNEPSAPELDHRLPISRGGGHTYWNAQCLCRRCNGLKAARVIICGRLNGEPAEHYADYVGQCIELSPVSVYAETNPQTVRLAVLMRAPGSGSKG